MPVLQILDEKAHNVLKSKTHVETYASATNLGSEMPPFVPQNSRIARNRYKSRMETATIQ